MKIAVTNHAVDRYQQRVEGAKSFDRESIRSIIRFLVDQGFENGMVFPHPTEMERRIIPFKSGESILYLSIGQNTTNFEADVAVIGVVFEKDVTEGKIGIGVVLEDALKRLKEFKVADDKPPRFIVTVGGANSIETYRFKSDEELKTFMSSRSDQTLVDIYELLEEQENPDD